MRKLEPVQLKAWTLPLIVVGVAVPIVAGFMLGGPPAGLAVGGIAAAVIVVVAVKTRFEEPMEVAASPGDRYRLLVVAVVAIEDPGLADSIAQIAEAGARSTGSDGREVLLLAPALNRPVAHWLSDLRGARFDAQRRLALSVGTLAAAGIEAHGEVGDTDPVQAVEDVLRTFPAQEVAFVAGPDHAGEVEEIRRRLDRPVRALEPAAPTRTGPGSRDPSSSPSTA
jgi:hypothetical protein